MKTVSYLSISLLIIVSVLAGCNNDERKIKQFYSKEPGTYTLFVIGDEEFDDVNLRKEAMADKFTTVLVYKEEAMESFKYLNLEESPAYIIFDHEKILYKTYNYSELVSFLDESDL